MTYANVAQHTESKIPVMTSRKLVPAKTPGSRQNRNPYRSFKGLLETSAVLRYVESR